MLLIGASHFRRTATTSISSRQHRIRAKDSTSCGHLCWVVCRKWSCETTTPAPPFSLDGTRMAFVRRNDPEPGKFSVLTTNTDGTDEKIIATGPTAFFPNLIAWFPDGNQIALVIPGPGEARVSIQLHDLISAKVRTLARFSDLPLNSIV